MALISNGRAVGFAQAVVFSLSLFGIVSTMPAGAETADKTETAEEPRGADLFTEALSAITHGKVSLDVNLRWENAKIERLNTSNAITVRTRLGYGTRPLYGLSGFLEFENVATPKPGLYFDGVDASSANKTIVADPEVIEANQFWLLLDRKDWGATSLKVGRQRIKLDDDRWIGNVGWRQNEQTYDALRLQSHLGHEALLVQYIFGWETNRIFGDQGPDNRRDFGMKSHLVNISYNFGEVLKTTGFVYLLDANDPFAANSSRTFGFRVAGRSPLTDTLDSIYEGSFAYQTDGADNPIDYDAFYYHVAAGLDLEGIGLLRLGYEVLGSDDGNAQVVTPLATAHKFNGYADAFLTNGGPRGLRDVYLVVEPHLPIDRLSLKLILHQFYSDQGGDNLGQEYDLVALYRCNAYLSFMYKLAYYDEGESGSPESRTRHFLQTKIQF